MSKKFSVLFVDDEVNILNSLRRGLIDEEYNCFFAYGGAEALEILKKEKICVIVTDMRMPGMDGLSLLKEVKAKYPNVVRIVLSGYTQLQQVLTTINQADVFKFITKPWKLEEEFKIVLNQAIEFYRLQDERNELEEALNKKNVAYQNILKNMEDVLKEAKKNAEGVRQLGKAAFSHMLASARDNSNVLHMTDQLERADRIFGMLAPVYAEDPKEINIYKFCEEIADYIKTLPGIVNSKAVFKIPAEVKCRVNNEMVRLLLTGLFETILDLNGKCSVKMMFEGKKLEQLEFLLEFSAIISHHDKAGQTGVGVNAGYIAENMELAGSMFGTLASYTGGSLAFGKSDEDNLLKLILRLKLS